MAIFAAGYPHDSRHDQRMRFGGTRAQGVDAVMELLQVETEALKVATGASVAVIDELLKEIERLKKVNDVLSPVQRDEVRIKRADHKRQRRCRNRRRGDRRG